MRTLPALVLIVAAVSASAAEPQSQRSIIVGIPKAQEYAGQLNCAPDICIDGFFRWTIELKRQISGPPVPRKVRAVTVQHAAYIFSERRPEFLFVLNPIVDPAVRSRFKAAYYLEARGARPKVFCFVQSHSNPSHAPLEKVGEIGAGDCVVEPPDVEG